MISTKTLARYRRVGPGVGTQYAWQLLFAEDFAAMPYNFHRPVEAPLLSATIASWRADIAANPANTINSYYEARLQHFQNAAEGRVFGNGEGELCAVIKDENLHADALIVVTYAHGSHLKMLDVTVRPSLNVADSDPDYAALAWIAAKAIVGCLALTYQAYPCDELKVFASWPLDKEFLTAVTAVMLENEEFGAMFVVRAHGSWIVLTKKR